MMDRYVDITFDCLPLRSVTRLDIPLDASPVYRARCERVIAAIEKHGTHNTYYLYNAKCVYHLLNSDTRGVLQFQFEGTVLTDASDERTQQVDLDVTLAGETCDWLTEPVVHWFAESVRHAVASEFNDYIAAGDLEKTRQRLSKVAADLDAAGGFVGMYL